MISKFIGYMKKNNYSKNTIVTYKNVLKTFESDFGDIRRIKRKIINISNANTAYLNYNVVMSYMNFIGDSRTKSLKEIKMRPTPTFYREVFTKKFLYSKTENLKDYRCVILRLLFETGIRASEIKTIKNINENTFKILGKGNKEREVFHNNETTKLFKGFNYSTKTLRFWVKEILGKKFTPHSIRRSHITHLLLNGANVKTVMLQVGHNKIETTYRYLNMSKKENQKNFRKHF